MGSPRDGDIGSRGPSRVVWEPHDSLATEIQKLAKIGFNSIHTAIQKSTSASNKLLTYDTSADLAALNHYSNDYSNVLSS